MKKIILILITIITISCKEDHSGHDHAKEDKNKETKSSSVKDNHNENEIHLTKAQFETAKIKVESIGKKQIRDRIEVTGTIEVPPQSKATVYAPMEAFVFKTDLLPGDRVHKGQTIAVLQHPNFINLQYAYLEAINKLNVAKADYERKKMLLENDITSKKSFQITEGIYRSAKSLASSYASQLKMAGLLPQTVAKNGIQQYVYVKAPIEGYIVENNLNKGMFLAANSEMMEIIDNDHMHAELNVFGTDIIKVKKGDTFIFTPSGLDVSYEGYIKLISQKVDDKTKTVNVHGHFEDEQNRLKSGMFINAQVLLDGNEVFAVPEKAIIDNEGESFIFMAKSNEEFVPLEVTLGNTDNGFTEIKMIQNNNYNIKVVTKGAHFLKGKLLQQAGGMDGHAH
ncbi:efflux RND transporter periplasmic adaptor subunit [uncultured Tenacibaculum sp.]|uniref:efflux RND transporter periplasmic adaptor subunit n=1 Tax=uncultured Tenacibaculum sp. TaxID=174713 RepID=UPI00262F15DA|nr:efflux RND transporter periplasmic adaptor subunit [uncultured Tenacibaculum sp.]